MTRIATIFGAAAFVLAAGCGGSSSDSSTPSVDGTKQISSVTDADKMSLCNWFAGLAGGYGTTSTCSMALITAPPTEADCVSSFPTCAVPVSTFEACVRVIESAQTTCTSASISAAQQDADCLTVGQAGCFN